MGQIVISIQQEGVVFGRNGNPREEFECDVAKIELALFRARSSRLSYVPAQHAMHDLMMVLEVGQSPSCRNRYPDYSAKSVC
jgi:hypothetical protein